MATYKVAISIDRETLEKLDRFVKENAFPSRSRAIQEAVEEKLKRIERSRLARECAKLDPSEERAMAEEGSAEDLRQWPKY
jgi:metal-responsive CopG/Arc/MetJ family transcriptional regulator